MEGNKDKIQQIQDLYVKNIKNDKKIKIGSVIKRFINKEIVEIGYESGTINRIRNLLTDVVNDDVDLWNKIIDKYPDYVRCVPRNYLTDDMLLKAYDKDNELINFLLEVKPEIVTEDMLKKDSYYYLSPKNKDNIRKIIKDDKTYETLVEINRKNIKIIPEDRKDLFMNDACYNALKRDPNLIRYIPKDCIQDNIYMDLLKIAGSKFIIEFPEDNENLFTKEICLKVLIDEFIHISFIPDKYITDDLCKSFSPFCDYIISNKDKIDTESTCIDFVNTHHFDNNTRPIIVLNYFKDILLLGKKYAGKAIDILIDKYPYLIRDTRINDKKSLDNDLYIKTIKAKSFLIYAIPQDKRTSEMYTTAFSNDASIMFPNNRKDIITDDFCIEYLKTKNHLHDISEEYRTEKVCLYAYEQDPYNINYFPKNMIHLFKEDMCIDCLTNGIMHIEDIPNECITAKIVEKAFEAKPHYILNDKCSKYITKEMCIKMVNEYDDLRFIDYIDDELLSEMHDIIMNKLTKK